MITKKYEILTEKIYKNYSREFFDSEIFTNLFNNAFSKKPRIGALSMSKSWNMELLYNEIDYYEKSKTLYMIKSI